MNVFKYFIKYHIYRVKHDHFNKNSVETNSCREAEWRWQSACLQSNHQLPPIIRFNIRLDQIIKFALANTNTNSSHNYSKYNGIIWSHICWAPVYVCMVWGRWTDKLISKWLKYTLGLYKSWTGEARVCLLRQCETAWDQVRQDTGGHLVT